MSQSPRACPTCGTPVPAGQRFCSNCGADVSAAGPASQYGGSGPQSQPASHPYDQSPYGQQANQQLQPGQQANQQYQPIPPYQQANQPYQQPPQKSNGFAELLGALGLVFFMRRYRPGYQARQQSSGCCGCLLAIVILGFIFGIPGYLYYRQHPHFIQDIQNQIQHSTSGSGSLPATQPAITTANINQAINYSGVDITIASVQQSSAFIDDSYSKTTGMIRVKIRESAGAKSGNYAYSDITRLILPDNSKISPLNEKNYTSPDTGTTRDNWLDFSVPTSAKIAQLTLLLGTDQQAQIAVPLTGKANLSAFQPKTSTPNAATQYDSMTWTVTKATRSLSENGTQAATGMEFVTLTLRIDNPTSNELIAYWGDYARLKSGNNTSAPSTDSTMPTTITANSSGTTGTLIFQVPSGNSSYTFILLNTPSTPYTQASINFQV